MKYTKEDIKRHIDEYARLTAEAAELAKKIDDEKVFFTELAERDLSDSKVKTKRYYGSTAKVTAVTSCSVKINREDALKKLFGVAYGSYIKEETKRDVKDAAAKRMLAAVFFDDYIAESAQNCINQMTTDGKQRRLLEKKLKGANPLTDADWIEKITGCSEDDATYYASVFAEVKAYEDFCTMARLAEVDEESAKELIHQGFTVEKTAKVGIELFED